MHSKFGDNSQAASDENLDLQTESGRQMVVGKRVVEAVKDDNAACRQRQTIASCFAPRPLREAAACQPIHFHALGNSNVASVEQVQGNGPS